MLYPIINFHRIRVCGKIGTDLKDDGQKIMFRGCEVNPAQSFKSYDTFMAFDTIRSNMIDRNVCPGCELMIVAQRRRYQGQDGKICETYVIVSFEVLSRVDDQPTQKQDKEKEEVKPVQGNKPETQNETITKPEINVKKAFTVPFSVDDLEAYFNC
jgi:hypothetical protein